MHLLDRSSEDAQSLPPVDGVNIARTDIQSLLLRYSELSQDVSHLRDLMENLARMFSYGEGSPRAKRASRNFSTRLDARRRASPQGGTRRPRDGSRRPEVRSKLERAGLIALMESSDPVSAETIYDRIERRGSFSFAGYKHPLRAITLAMGAMVRHGEVLLHNEGGRRRWRWEPTWTPSERPVPLTLP
jgi:hypothetical protein